MTERKKRLDLLLVVVAIADEDALAVPDSAVLARVVDEGRVVLQAYWEGLRQTSGRISLTEQHVGDGVAALLARVPRLEHRRHPGQPWHRHGPTGLQNHDRSRVRRCHSGDQLVLAS